MKGATAQLSELVKGQDISIHAPVKGATNKLKRREQNKNISIHAPVKGATQYVAASSSFSADFNPRSREGSDAKGFFKIREILISIHAPVKGATFQGLRTVCKYRIFQSTLP